VARNPFATPLLQPSASAPRAKTAAPAAAPADPDALYHRLVKAAATSRDRAGFLRAHQHELAQLAPTARQVVVRSAGLGLDQQTVEKALSRGSYANTQLRKAAEDVKGIPGGLVHAAGAGVSDAKDTLHGHPTVKRTLKVAKQTGEGIVETVEHPGRDLFQTATLAGAAVSGGAGIAGRVAAVGDVVKGTLARDLPEAVGRLSKADAKAYATLANPDKHLPHVDEPTARRIATPSPELGRVLDLDGHIAAVRSEVLKALGEGKVIARKAARGSAVREAGASKPARIAKAAVKTPLPRQRTLTVPGEDGKPAIVVHPVASKNALANIVERKVIDPLRQRQLDKAGPAREFQSPTVQKAAEAAQRVGSAQTKVGRELRAARTVKDALELAPVSRLERFHPSAPARGLTRVTGGRVNVPTLLPRKLGGERLSAAEQKAVDIMAAGTNPGKAIAYHENLIAKGVGDATAHRLQIALSKAAGPHFNRLMVGDHPKLQQAVEETRAVIQKGEGLKGMTPEEIAHRVGARKADIEAIAAGKVSPLEELQTLAHLDEPGVARARGQVARLEERYAKAEKQVAKRKFSPRERRMIAEQGLTERVTQERPRTREEAQRQLDRLDADWEKAVAKVYESTRGEFDKAETARRNKLRAQYDRQQQGVTRAGTRSGAGGRKVVQHRPQTLSQEAYAQAERTLLATIEKHRGNSVSKRLLGVKQRRDQLRAELNASHPVLGERQNGDFGQVRKRADVPVTAHEVGNVTVTPRGALVRPQGTARLERAGGALSVAKDRLQSAEKAAASRRGMTPEQYRQAVATSERRAQEIHDTLVAEGFKAVENGAFYLPSKDKAATMFRHKIPATRQPGEYGLGPQGPHPALAHEYTGSLQRSGRQRSDATRLAAESFKQAQRYAALERGHRQLLAAARETPEEAGGQFAIPIRTTVAIPEGLRRLVRRQDVGTLTRADVKDLGQGDLESFAKALFPDPKELADMKGVKWIDSRLLGGLRGQSASFGGGAGSFLDAVNSPFRAALLYTKPSYALNLVQALGTNVIQQGVFTPLNLRRALGLAKQLGAEDQHALFSLAGQGRSRALEATGAASRAINSSAEFWNVIVDRYPRVASLLHEMRREGLNTPEKIHALLNDPRYEAKLVEITRRGNKEAIEYGDLSPFEKNVLRRALFFYPWMRAATLYSLRFPKEHPIQAAAYAQLGAQGHERSVKAFGPFVDYGPGTAGLVPIGKNRGANLSNLNTFSTPVELGEAIADPTKIPQMAGPLPGAIYTAISHKTPLGVELPATKNPYAAAAQQLTDLVPLMQAVNRAKAPPPTDKVVKQPIYPKGVQAAVERYVGGSAFPQPVNKPALAAKGEKNYVSKLGPEEKAKYTAAKTLRQAEADATALHKAGVLRAPGLPPSVRQALDLDRRRKVGYAQAQKQKGASLSATDRALVVSRIVREAKTAPPQVVRNFEQLVARAPDAHAVSTITARFWRVYGRGAALSSWRGYVTTNKRQR
jgi:hypothetical protein